jgi:hypothetical protein
MFQRHAGGQALTWKPSAASTPGEQAVLLEAIAAAAAGDQLGVDGGGGDVDPAVQQAVDRLERDRGRMQGVQRAQHRSVGVRGPS